MNLFLLILQLISTKYLYFDEHKNFIKKWQWKNCMRNCLLLGDVVSNIQLLEIVVQMFYNSVYQWLKLLSLKDTNDTPETLLHLFLLPVYPMIAAWTRWQFHLHLDLVCLQVEPTPSAWRKKINSYVKISHFYDILFFFLTMDFFCTSLIIS